MNPTIIKVLILLLQLLALGIERTKAIRSVSRRFGMSEDALKKHLNRNGI